MRSTEVDSVDLRCFQHRYDRWDEGSLWKNQYIVNSINSIIIILQILIFKKSGSVV